LKNGNIGIRPLLTLSQSVVQKLQISIVSPNVRQKPAPRKIINNLPEPKNRVASMQSGIVEHYSGSCFNCKPIARDLLNRHKKRLCIDYSQTEADQKYTAFEANGRLDHFRRVPFGVTNGVAVFQRAMDKFVDEEGLKDTFPYLDNITVAGRDQEEHDENVQTFHEAIRRRNLTLNETKSVESKSSINLRGYGIGHGVITPDPERLRPLQEFPPPESARTLQRVVGMFAYYAKWIPHFSDKIKPLMKAVTFPLDSDALAAFNTLKKEFGNAALQHVDESLPFVVECDASEVALSATLNQAGRPVAFMTRMLHGSELHYPAVEKEAMAIVEAVRKWQHFLARRHFTLKTDQRSYTVEYRPGKDNVTPDSFTRAFSASISSNNLEEIRIGSCHPGVTRMLHF
ncbi:Hypothetical predicted protein, partial [Paramuricea clavata]